jgi:uncharacterized protein (DUF1810 family)
VEGEDLPRRFSGSAPIPDKEHAMSDTHNLDRFVEAQQPVLEQVRRELEAGNKRSHWMWFVFPQIEGLGRSSMAQRYAIKSMDEAKAYLTHPELGKRLREWTQLVLDVEGKGLTEIFGTPDNMKFCSSMTLFREAARENSAQDDETLFDDAISKYCGSPDEKTLSRLR